MTTCTFFQKNSAGYIPLKKNGTLKISVIIPVYNCHEFLDDCLRSVTGQTYRNLEIILVDDGSTDGSEHLCDVWKEKDNRIIVVHQANSGVSAARNHGLSLATGTLYSFIDADDTLEADMYEFLVHLMLQYEADIAHCGYKHIVEDEVRLVHDTKEVYVQTSEEALRCLVGGRLFVGSLWNKLYRAQVVQSIRFREDIRINEDILYNFEAFRRAKKTVFADDAKYHYIAHRSSSACFVTPERKKTADTCAVNQYIYSELQFSPLAEVAVERYLRSLSCYYRACMAVRDKDVQYKEIVTEMCRVYNGCKKQSMSRTIKLTVFLIKYFPHAYGLIYAVYNKIRKPNWEV